MNNNKKRGKKSKTKKEYKLSEYKTKEERQEQVKTIIKEITNLGLSIQYEPVKELYTLLQNTLMMVLLLKLIYLLMK